MSMQTVINATYILVAAFLFVRSIATMDNLHEAHIQTNSGRHRRIPMNIQRSIWCLVFTTFATIIIHLLLPSDPSRGLPPGVLWCIHFRNMFGFLGGLLLLRGVEEVWHLASSQSRWHTVGGGGNELPEADAKATGGRARPATSERQLPPMHRAKIR